MAVYFTGKPEDRGRFGSALMISNHPIREAEAACASTAPPTIWLHATGATVRQQAASG